VGILILAFGNFSSEVLNILQGEKYEKGGTLVRNGRCKQELATWLSPARLIKLNNVLKLS